MSKTENMLKRWIDILLSLTGLMIAGPVVLLCMFWVMIKDSGPVLYSQWRVGHEGRFFKIYKLRTMVINAENGIEAVLATANDSRVIKGCHWMRRSHLDELPQLWNILVGDMSLVGPRPERPEILNELTSHIPNLADRLLVKPGLTGLAQVHNGYSCDIEGMRRKFHYDMEYVSKHSLTQDLWICVRTLPKFWDRAAN